MRTTSVVMVTVPCSRIGGIGTLTNPVRQGRDSARLDRPRDQPMTSKP
jgi:hypothetical protein